MNTLSPENVIWLVSAFIAWGYCCYHIGKAKGKLIGFHNALQLTSLLNSDSDEP